MTLPFEGALGTAAQTAAPKVREHFLMSPGSRRYAGTMRRVWRARGWRGVLAWPVLKISAWADLLFTDSGTDVPFEMVHVVKLHDDGRARMTWTRTFRFPGVTRRFHATMVYDPARGLIDDRMGATGWLEVELIPRIENGALHMQSARQWVHAGPLRVRLPKLIAGEARIHEWEDPRGGLCIRVTIHNPLLGEIFGYEGGFDRVE